MILGNQLPLDNVIYRYQLKGDGHVSSISADDSPTKEAPFWLHADLNNEVFITWLKATPLLSDALKEVFFSDNSRPSIHRFTEGTVIILRCIDDKAKDYQEGLLVIRIFISETLIISTRDKPIKAIDMLNNNIIHQDGPTDSCDWLIDLGDELTEQLRICVENIHEEKIDKLEELVLDEELPEQGQLASVRKELIMLRRYLLPQRDVFSRLAIEKTSWMDSADMVRIKELSERVGRVLEDIDAAVARTMIISDEIKMLIGQTTNKRMYIMSLLAMLFLPLTFLTGLLGVNLGGIPGEDSDIAFASFCLVILVISIVLGWLLRKSDWL